jgi:hypothetical protein
MRCWSLCTRQSRPRKVLVREKGGRCVCVWKKNGMVIRARRLKSASIIILLYVC